MEASHFNDWQQRDLKLGIYGAVNEGSFDFGSESNQTVSELQRQFGPRQYLQAFPSFSIYAPVNFFHLSCKVQTLISSTYRLFHSCEQALLDLATQNVQQVIICGSNLSADRSQKFSEGVFFISTNSQDWLRLITKRILDLQSEEEVYANPIKQLGLESL